MMQAALQTILRCGDFSSADADRLHFAGTDPVFPTPYRIGTAAAAALGALGLALDNIRSKDDGARREIDIEVRAAAASLRAFTHYTKINGKPARPTKELLFGFHRMAGGRWSYFHCSQPHHREALLGVLGVPANRARIAEAALRWEAVDLENAVDAAGGCAPAVRTPEEWQLLPNTISLANEALVEVRKITDSNPIPLPKAPRPLSGIRVLDLTRVLAGPTCNRLLAEYGADVLKITCEHYPDSPFNELDTGYGKRTAIVDIASSIGHKTLTGLTDNCDVFCQAYRPDALSKLGFSPEQIAAQHPGIVYASLSAYGFSGNWRKRRGFDTVIQGASGMAYVSGRGNEPRLTPAAALDYLSGYLLAFGVVDALNRRAKQGGSYCVNVSLAGVKEWLTALGLFDWSTVDEMPPEIGTDELTRWLINVPTPNGELTRLRPLIRFSDDTLTELPEWRNSEVLGASWAD